MTDATNDSITVRILSILYKREQMRDYMAIGFNPLMKEAGIELQNSREIGRIKDILTEMARIGLVDRSAMGSVCLTPAGSKVFEEFQRTGRLRLL